MTIRQYLLTRTMTIEAGGQRDREVQAMVKHTTLNAQLHTMNAEVQAACDEAELCVESSARTLGRCHHGTAAAYHALAEVLTRYYRWGGG